MNRKKDIMKISAPNSPINPYSEYSFVVNIPLLFETLSEITCSFSRMLKFSRAQASNFAGLLDDDDFLDIVNETAHTEKKIDMDLLLHKVSLLCKLLKNSEIDSIDISDIFSTSEDNVELALKHISDSRNQISLRCEFRTTQFNSNSCIEHSSSCGDSTNFIAKSKNDTKTFSTSSTFLVFSDRKIDKMSSKTRSNVIHSLRYCK